MKVCKKILLIILAIFFVIYGLKSYASISLECNSCKKQIEGYMSNKELLEQKLILEREKEVINQDVISSIELRVQEYNEKISELQDVLDICNGKRISPNLAKCSRYAKQIEGYESNVKILEQKISSENAKEIPSVFVVNAAQTKIIDLKKQIASFRDILKTCEEVQVEEKLPESTVDLSP